MSADQPTVEPSALDPAIHALLRAMHATVDGDRLAASAAHSELAQLAGTADDFETKLISAFVDKLAPILKSSSRDEIAHAVATDIRRHVTRPCV